MVVAGWAAYLLPLWQHRHDAVSEMKSIQGFSTAMRTLSRRTTTNVEGRVVMMPRTTEATTRAIPPAVHVSGAGVRRAAERRLARKRAVLIGLLLALAASVPATVFLHGPARLGTPVLLVAFLVYAGSLRREAVLRADRRHQLRKQALQRRMDAERRAYEERMGRRPKQRAPLDEATTVPFDRLAAGGGVTSARHPRTEPPAYTEEHFDQRRAAGH